MIYNVSSGMLNTAIDTYIVENPAAVYTTFPSLGLSGRRGLTFTFVE